MIEESTNEKRRNEDANDDDQEEKRQRTSENQDVSTASGLNNNNPGAAAVPFYSSAKSSSIPDTRKAIEQLHPVTGQVLRVYPGGSDAAKFMGISQGGISLCCHGKQADANGFCWRFYEGPPLVWDEALEARQMTLQQLKIIQHQKLKSNKPKEGNSYSLPSLLCPCINIQPSLPHKKLVPIFSINSIIYYSHNHTFSTIISSQWNHQW